MLLPRHYLFADCEEEEAEVVQQGKTVSGTLQHKINHGDWLKFAQGNLDYESMNSMLSWDTLSCKDEENDDDGEGLSADLKKQMGIKSTNPAAKSKAKKTVGDAADALADVSKDAEIQKKILAMRKLINLVKDKLDGKTYSMPEGVSMPAKLRQQIRAADGAAEAMLTSLKKHLESGKVPDAKKDLIKAAQQIKNMHELIKQVDDYTNELK